MKISMHVHSRAPGTVLLVLLGIIMSGCGLFRHSHHPDSLENLVILEMGVHDYTVEEHIEAIKIPDSLLHNHPDTFRIVVEYRTDELMIFSDNNYPLSDEIASSGYVYAKDSQGSPEPLELWPPEYTAYINEPGEWKIITYLDSSGREYWEIGL